MHTKWCGWCDVWENPTYVVCFIKLGSLGHYGGPGPEYALMLMIHVCRVVCTLKLFRKTTQPLLAAPPPIIDQIPGDLQIQISEPFVDTRFDFYRQLVFPQDRPSTSQ